MDTKVQNIKSFLSEHITYVIAAVIVLVLWVGYNHYSSDAQNAAQNIIKIDVIKVEHVELNDALSTIGTAKANESVELTSKGVHKIKAIYFDDNAFVKEGDVILEFEQDEERAQLAASESKYQESKREKDRIQKLHEKEFAPQQQLDAKTTQVEVSKQEKKQLKARIEQLTIRAPFDGQLGIRRYSVGSVVESGSLINTIDDISVIKLDFNVPSIYLASLKVGNSIKATTDAIHGVDFEGEIKSIDTRVDNATRSVLVRAMIQNPGYLIKPGLLMKVMLVMESAKVIVVPEESIAQKREEHFVYVLNAEKDAVIMRKVEIGRRVPGFVEITSGLQDGEVVATSGMMKLQDGSKVSVSLEGELPKIISPDVR